MLNLIPLFTSDYSLKSKSILTIDKADKIIDTAPISIVSIAKNYDIQPCFVIESTPTSFLKSYKFFGEQKIPFIYGIRLTIVDNASDKSNESLNNESKIVILLNNSAGYKNFLKIYTTASTNNFYYIPRTCWKDLKDNWSDNLTLAVPFYDSFLFNNLLANTNIVPEFPAEPVLFREEHELPFDYLAKQAVENYASQNSYKIQDTHSVYYYKSSDILAYQVFRTMSEGSSMDMPNLNHFCSDKFSFESFLNRKGLNL